MSRAITTHHSPAPDRVTNHEPATPPDHGRGKDRNGRPIQREDAGEARDKGSVGVGGGASDRGSPDAATGRDWKGC